MKKNFTIVTRGSLLALAQVEIFMQQASAAFPGLQFEIVVKESEGDLNQQQALYELEGRDFFTKDIHAFLADGRADFAVHSLKDVSGESFFEGYHFAIINRDDPRDVVIFNHTIIDKLQQGDVIRIGTCSPRRIEMAVDFLQQALPQLHAGTRIEALPIRGNVDTRLQKLTDGAYDGIILAAAGLNRLLRHAPATERVQTLLRDKKLMVLPLVECTPAPCQGAIVVETLPSNADAVTLLKAVNDPALSAATVKERRLAHRYGSGCHQRFGVTHITHPLLAFTFAAGRSDAGQLFSDWQFESPALHDAGVIFSTADFMQSFAGQEPLSFEREWVAEAAVFIAHHKTIHSPELWQLLRQKRVWAAGTHTWFKLAQQGVWVEGCADGWGLSFAEKTLNSPLIGLDKNSIRVLTYNRAVSHWASEGWKVSATYNSLPQYRPEIAAAIRNADLIFWTSFQQYELYRDDVHSQARHACPAGKTAVLLRAAGKDPVIFPGIKAFKQWQLQQQRNITATSEG